MSKNEFIKKPHEQMSYTQEQMEELHKCGRDPIYFISNYCYIQNQDLGKVLFKLRPYQKRIIQALHKNRNVIILAGRQCGKSESTSAYAYWFSIFHDDKNVLIASNKQKGASDLMNRIRFMYENTPDFLRPGAMFYNRGSLEFDNGSRIWSEATTIDTGRGKSVALFLCDELAHVKSNIQEEMWSSIQPTISSGGSLSCVIMSTPNGDSDLFATLWRGANSSNGIGKPGINGFVPVEVKIDEVPGRDMKWQQRMIEQLGDLKFRQEFLAEFLSSDPLLIKSTTLIGLKPQVPIFVDKGFSFWRNIDPNKTYVVAADVAEGVKQDFSTVQVLELDTLVQVAEFRNNEIREAQLYNAIKWIIQKLLSVEDPRTHRKAQVYWSFENNSAGASIGTLYYQDENFPPEAELISGKAERVGFRTVNKPKIEACRHLKNLVEKTKGGLTLNSEALIFELKNYIAKGASYAAKTGCTDDLVSAFLIVMRVIRQLSEYEPEVFDKLYHSEGEFYDETTNAFDEPMPFVMP